jgi:HNH endonuclease
MVTIDYRDLLDRLEHSSRQGRRRPRAGIPAIDTATGTATGTVWDTGAGWDAGTDPSTRCNTDAGTRGTPDAGPDPDTPGNPAPGTGTFTFTGPVTPATVRKIACDADIIPVLLGSEGRILDIGRSSRIFPPHIRKAITARDQGCAFPQCTFPAPWCEAHHISYWSHGGTTSTENGTLLCPHHHHLIHKEEWSIQVQGGIPWFIPPAHVDPRQVPRRNHYFRLE